MKNTWMISCVALLATANIGFCDETAAGIKTGAAEISRPAAVASGDAAVNVPTTGLRTWTVSTAPIRPIKTAGVRNFGKLNANIWRSGQPTREGYNLLASQGLKTVVNLRAEFPQDKDLIPPGVQYIYIPIKDEHAPTQEQAEQFIKAASDPANWPLLVHCHAGEGRAGTMAALVRCTLDKWNDTEVMKETNTFITTKVLGFKPPLANCQRQLIRKWESDASESVSNVPG